MNRKHEIILSDDMIRQALKSDIESIKPPSVDRAWMKIEAGLAEQKHSSKKRFFFSPSRFTYAAAAFLILSLGVFGVLQLQNQSMPAAEDDLAFEALRDAAPEPGSAENGAVMMVEEGEPTRQIMIYGRLDNEPPDWQPQLVGGYEFGEALILSGTGEPDYRGAVYYSPEATLLWVKSYESAEELPLFLDRVGMHIDEYIEITGRFSGTKSFEAAGQPGLAWQADGLNQAFLVLDGFLSPERLIFIAENLYEQ